MIFRFFLASLALMALELALLIELVQELGFLAVAALLFLSAIAGVLLIRLEGFRLVVEARTAIADGRLPERGMVDRLMVFLGALLLIAPGVISDAVALILFIPWTRRFIARRVERSIRERFVVQHFHYRSQTIDTEGEFIEDEVIEGEIVHEPGREDDDLPRLPPRG